jgi:hypothetical protein
MTRSRVIHTLTASLLFVALPLIAVAAEPAAAPPGLRILYSGDSWHRFMPSLMERIGAAAGITDQKLTVGWALNTGGYGKLGTVLDEGTFDAMSWGRPGWDQGGLQQFLGQGVIDKGLKNNRQFRFYVQMAWNVSDGRGGIKTVADYDAWNLADVQAAYDRGRKGVEALADEINAKQSRRVMFLVPVGEAVTKLRGMIVEGKVPGVERQSQVFTDAMPHAGPLAAELAAYCNYAAIYRSSPEGLAIKDGVPAEQRAIIQAIAWETVSKYAYAGVSDAK